MRESDDVIASHAVGEQALRSMMRWSLPSLPRNYLVWFTHHAGEMPELSRRIRLLEAHPDGLRPDEAALLFEDFFALADEASAIRLAGDRLTHTLDQVGGEITHTTAQTQAYRGALVGWTERLRRGGGDAAKAAAQLLAGTGEMVARMQQCELMLARASEETRDLRDQLQQAETVALTDPLTGLGNRRRFYKVMSEAMRMAEERRQALSLCMLDVDHFQMINELHGHALGDQILRLLGQRVAALIGQEGTVIRWGGQELMIVLPDRTHLEARELVEGVRTLIERSRIKLKGSGQEMAQLTVSLGVAERRAQEDSTELVERAQRAVHLAKASGRNQVVVDDGRAIAGRTAERLAM